MGSDYTVIEAVRHQLGDDPGRGRDVFTDEGPVGDWESAPFAGRARDWLFACPRVDPSQWAVLQFNAIGVDYRDNVIRVNGVSLPGGMYQSPESNYVDEVGAEPYWHMQSLLVPADTLREQKNLLHIESTRFLNTDFDDFIVDNIIIWFKVRDRPRVVAAAEA
jgi:hypothetical protein